MILNRLELKILSTSLSLSQIYLQKYPQKLKYRLNKKGVAPTLSLSKPLHQFLLMFWLIFNYNDAIRQFYHVMTFI